MTSGTPAHQKLHQGDVIVGIQGHDATMMSHQECHDFIASAGNSITLMIRK